MLPKEFEERMQQMLKDEYEAFISSYQKGVPVFKDKYPEGGERRICAENRIFERTGSLV